MTSARAQCPQSWLLPPTPPKLLVQGPCLKQARDLATGLLTGQGLGWRFAVAAALSAEQPRKGWSQSVTSFKNGSAFPVGLRVVETCKHALRAARVVSDGPLASARADLRGAVLQAPRICACECTQRQALVAPPRTPYNGQRVSAKSCVCSRVSRGQDQFACWSRKHFLPRGEKLFIPDGLTR